VHHHNLNEQKNGEKHHCPRKVTDIKKTGNVRTGSLFCARARTTKGKRTIATDLAKAHNRRRKKRWKKKRGEWGISQKHKKESNAHRVVKSKNRFGGKAKPGMGKANSSESQKGTVLAKR